MVKDIFIQNKKTNDNKIKVYLQYPWKFPDSPYYKYLLQQHSDNVEYINVENQKGVITKKKKFAFSNYLKKIIRGSLNLFHISLPNKHKTKDGSYDLIHCAHCVSGNMDKPWVCDIESEWQLFIGNKNRFSKREVKLILERDNCKKVLAWTKETYNELIKEYPTVKDKITIVYPPIPSLNVSRKKHLGIVLFFVARYFYWKGGLDALEVMDRLTKKYDDVSAILVSEVPEDIKEKYSRNKKIKIYGLMSQNELFEKVYSIGDIFVYPGYSDSFGFAIPEVMSLGVPVISLDISTRAEIITHNKNGFLVKYDGDKFDLIKKTEKNKLNENEINEMCKYTSQLIENKILYKTFSKNAKDEIINGKFSIEKINKQMYNIYCNAIK